MKNMTPFSSPLAAVVLLSAACGPSVKTVEVSPSSATLSSAGQPQKLSATAKDAKGQPVEKVEWTWSSSAPQVASVDATGQVRAVKSGSAVISARAGEVSGSATIEVRIPAKIAIEPATITLSGVGTAAPINARVEDEIGRPIPDAKVSFAATTPGVASVGQSQVIALGPGTSTVEARIGALVATAQVTVVLPPFAKIAIAPDKVKLAPGATERLTATATDDAGNAVPGMVYTWSSSDEKVATVDATGLVTAAGKGKATITAAAGDKKATAAVEVK